MEFGIALQPHGRDAERSIGSTSSEQTTQSPDPDSEAPGPFHFQSIRMAQFSEAATEGQDHRMPGDTTGRPIHGFRVAQGSVKP